MNDKRTLKNAQENIENGTILPHDNLLALLDAYIYGTATPMIALIKTLKLISAKILNNEVVKYLDESNIERIIDTNSFTNFILEYFDVFVLEQVYKDC